MSFAIALSGFCLGFTFGIMAISRVSIRPQITRALRKTGLIKSHKARRPNGETWLEL